MLHRARATAAVALLLLLPALSAFAAALPGHGEPRGAYAVGFTSFELHDASRNRTLPVQVWYPARPSEARGAPPAIYGFLFFTLESRSAVAGVPVASRGRFPLVVFSHGSGGIGIQSFFLTEQLASHGFVVVAPDHIGNTLIDAAFGDLGEDDLVRSAIDRPQDVSLLIDTMLDRTRAGGDFFHGALDPSQIGVVGHSFGGFTALAVAGGFRGETAGAFGIDVPDDFEPIPPDPRVRAIVPIAPASSPLGDGELAGIRVPTLLIGGTLDRTTPVIPEITRAFATIRAHPVYRADLRGAAHFSFTDACELIGVALDAGLPASLIEDLVDGIEEEGCSPDLMPVAEAHRLTNLLTVAFLRRYLAGDRRYERLLDPVLLERREPDLDFFRRPPMLPPWLLWRPGHHF